VRRERPAAQCAIHTWTPAGPRLCGQQALVAAALELLSRAKIGMRDPILSTLAPVSFAGLAAGPYAALLAGCALHLHGPFDAAAFLATFETRAPTHLVAPVALAEALAADGPLGLNAISSLMLAGAVTRRVANGDVPVIDLHALDAAQADAPAAFHSARR
jgi:hypothetical protein